MKTKDDAHDLTPRCTASSLSKGKVKCDRDQYAFGLCQAHYKQYRVNKPLTPIHDRSDVELVALTVRIPRAVHDQILLAAAEQAVSPYELHRLLLESWSLRRTARRR